MQTTSLRKVGGSVMLAVPPVLLEMIDLQAGAIVNLTVEGGRLVVHPQKKPHYTLEQLLAKCNAKARATHEDRAWIDLGPAGKEL